MKKRNKSTPISEIYREAGYSDEILTSIERLGSEYESVEDVLSRYRYIQPGEELFSERSLKIISALYFIEKLLESQRDATHIIEERLRDLIDLTLKQKGNFPSDNNVF